MGQNEQINDFPTVDIKYIPKHNISIPPNNTTTYSQNINIGRNIKHKSHRTFTCHNITSIDTKKNTESVFSAFSRDDHDNDSSNEDYLQIGHRTYMELLDVFTGILLYPFLFVLALIKVLMF